MIFIVIVLMREVCPSDTFCDEFCAELDDLCIDERDEELIFKCDVDECLNNCNSYSEEKRRRLATCYRDERYQCGTWTWAWVKKPRYCYRQRPYEC